MSFVVMWHFWGPTNLNGFHILFLSLTFYLLLCALYHFIMSLWSLLFLMLLMLPIPFKGPNCAIWGHLVLDTSAPHPSLSILPCVTPGITDELVVAEDMNIKRGFCESDSTLVIENWH
jgi:hypothetical protein